LILRRIWECRLLYSSLTSALQTVTLTTTLVYRVYNYAFKT